jgi:GAF domain-containing protein
MRRYSRLPDDFVDRLRDLLSTVQAEQLMMRADADRDRLRRIIGLATRQTGAQVGMLLLVNEDRGDLQVAAAVGQAVQPLLGGYLARTSLAGFAVDDGQPVAVADSASAPGGGAGDEVDQRTDLVTRNLLVVPLVIHGQSAGALELRNSPKPRGFDPDDVELAVELAYLAAAAVEEHRGDRFLFGLFAGALPVALDPDRGALAESLADELQRWLSELRQTPAWRQQLELVAEVRELCMAGDEAVDLARTILGALVDAERRRREDAEI